MTARSRIVCTVAIFLLYPKALMAHGDEPHEALKKARRPQPKATKSSDGHNHSHDTSLFSFDLGLGAAISKPLTNPTASSSQDSAQALSLDGGHDHGGSGSEGSSGNPSTALTPYLTAGVGMKLGERYNVSLSETFDLAESAVGDPSLSLGYSQKLAKNMSGISSLSLSLPISKVSQDTYKITTISAAAGPKFRLSKKLSFSVLGSIGFSWYKKTVIAENANDGTNLTSNQSRILDEEEELPESDDATAAQVTPNREFSRYVVKTSASYQVMESIRLDSGVGIGLVKLQFGDPYWNLEATILQASYSF